MRQNDTIAAPAMSRSDKFLKYSTFPSTPVRTDNLCIVSSYSNRSGNINH